MKIELILLGVIGVVFLLDFILNSIKKKSVSNTVVDQFEGSKSQAKKSLFNYVLNRKKNISLAILLVPVIKVLIHFLVYPVAAVKYANLLNDPAFLNRDSLRYHIDNIFTLELWLFLPALFLVLFVSWFFSDKIKAR